MLRTAARKTIGIYSSWSANWVKFLVCRSESETFSALRPYDFASRPLDPIGQRPDDPDFRAFAARRPFMSGHNACTGWIDPVREIRKFAAETNIENILKHLDLLMGGWSDQRAGNHGICQDPGQGQLPKRHAVGDGGLVELPDRLHDLDVKPAAIVVRRRSGGESTIGGKRLSHMILAR